MKNEGRFYLSYEKEDGNEYSVSREIKLPSDYVVITDNGKAEILAQLANALLRSMGISESIQLQVHNSAPSWATTVSVTGCCTDGIHNR